MAKCRDCGHIIVFVKMRNSGKLCPVAPNPDEIGTIVARRNPDHSNGVRYIDGIVRHFNITLSADQVRLIHHRGVCTHPRYLPKAQPVPTETPQPALI